jgi:hypothetical protein
LRSKSRIGRLLHTSSRADLRHRDKAAMMAPTTVTVPVAISRLMGVLPSAAAEDDPNAPRPVR